MAEQTIIDPAEQNNAGFDYTTLGPDDAEFLRNQAAYINARRHITHQLITEMGGALIAAKYRLPGVFLLWSRLEFGFSDDTIENYMNVAKWFPALENSSATSIQLRALYKLSSINTDESARTEAAQLSNAGQTVDYKTAYILAEAPVEVKTDYLNETLPKDSAYEMARVYKKKSLPQTVRDVCISHRVSSPEIVDYLAEAYLDYQRTKGTIHERSTYADIENDKFHLNGLGWSVPISQARAVDIQRYKVDRAFMHRDLAPKRYEWLETNALVQKTPDGRLVIVLEKPDFAQLEGALLMLKVRLPIQES